MRHRLDLAASLIVPAEVYFLDERTTGLDPASRAQIHQIVRVLASGGATVLLTTQCLDEGDELAASPLGTTWMASKPPEGAVHIRRIARRRHPTARPHRVATTAPLSCPLAVSPGKSCPRLGAEMGAAICRQLRSDAVRRGDRGPTQTL